MSETSGTGQPLEAPYDAPEADVIEQRAALGDEIDGDAGPEGQGEPPLDADPADVADQRREVRPDEDDYR
ncbi:hypothetical protein [Actinomadura parmotrematis]|uniref:DUF5709 domain-containing protein n=1 Tax=Actinomadura parmotrematis TaxID=2864039 RepID=A0ABS7FLS8_9ACTN|nr:hypothetical protein [Actinomadura parmotrematis]MBW8481304.1 hypothetical protein [Actinomadura parmotrematis]